MSDLERLRSDVLEAFHVVFAEIDGELAGTRRRMLEEGRERLENDTYFVVVCGEFRRGKSSLLNALVERPRLFPVDVDVTTSTVTTLRWGKNDRAVVYFAINPNNPDIMPEEHEIPFSEIKEYVTEKGNPRNVKNVARIEMEAAIPHLRNGLVLVDTPGVGSVNPAHTAATRAFLPRADAILFVASAVEPLASVELEFLLHALSECPIVVTAITMTDRVVNPDPVIAEARERIAKVAGRDAGSLVVVGVSSHRKRDAIEDDDDELLADSGFPELEGELWRGLTITCGSARIHAALDGLDAALADVAAPLANELAALRDDSVLVRMEEELKAAQEESRRLRSSGSQWRRDLADELDLAVRPIRDHLGDEFESVRKEFRRALESDEAFTDPGALVRRASARMVDAANRAGKDLERAATDLAVRYAELTSGSLTAEGVSTSLFTPELDEFDNRPGPEMTGFRKFRSAWGGGIAGGGLGVTVGVVVGSIVPVIGSFLGGVVGGLLGQITGWFGGARQAQLDNEARRRREHVAGLKDQVLPAIESGRRKTEQSLTYQIRDYGRALTAALDDHITAQTESLAESVRRLGEARRHTAQERATLLPSLAAREARLTVIRQELDDLRSRTAALSRAD